MTSALMVWSGLARRRRADRFGVTRFLAAAFRFFAIAWSSFDGVANSRHCTSTHEFRSTDFKTNQPRDLAVPARNIENRITEAKLSDSDTGWVNQQPSGRSSRSARSASASSRARSRRHSNVLDRSPAMPGRNNKAREAGKNAPRARVRSLPGDDIPAEIRSRANDGSRVAFSGRASPLRPRPLARSAG